MRAVIAAAALMPGLARADTGGAGEWMYAVLFVYACIYYLALCVVSVPLAWLLRGSKLKRIAIGFVVPMIGVAGGAWTVYWLDRKHYLYYVDNDGNMVFYVLSAIPMALLLIWAVVSRARAEAFESSRVEYANYLEARKGERELAKRANEG